MKEARALFANKVSVDDDMLEYLMEMETPKEAWDIYASMLAKNSKPIEENVCYECGKLGHIVGGCKVMMVVVEGDSTTEGLRQGEANECGEPLRMMLGTQRRISQPPSKAVIMH